MSSEHINSELHKVETSPSAINASPFAEKEFNKTVSGVPIKMPFITEKKDFSSVDVKDKSPESTAKDDTNFTFRKFISGEKEYKFCVTKSITAEHSELELKKIEQIQHSDSNKNLMSNDVNGRLIEKIAKKFELSTQSQNGKVDIEKPQRLQKIFSLVEEDLDFLDF